MTTIKSKMMDELYGEELSQDIFEGFNTLDPMFNRKAQAAYDNYWSLPGLSLRDKSLVTVASLVALGIEVQTKIHMHGFLYVDGTKEELVSILVHLSTMVGTDSARRGFAALKEVLIVFISNTFVQ